MFNVALFLQAFVRESLPLGSIQFDALALFLCRVLPVGSSQVVTKEPCLIITAFRSCTGLNSILCKVDVPLEPQNETLFINRVFADVISQT